MKIEYRAINASKFNDKYDKLISVYPVKEETDLAKLNGEAIAITEKLKEKNLNLVQKVEVLNPFVDGVNPTNGETITLQKSFDRFITRDANGNARTRTSVLIGVIGTEGADTLALTDQLETAIRANDGLFDKNSVDIEISSDFSESIKSQVDTLQGSLLEGLVIVLAVGFILISLRAGLVTALAMTTTLLITVGALFSFGMSLNTITLFGLILCLGLIVDDATIMVEALDAARKMKKSKTEIVSEVSKKVALASLAGTLTTMLGFAPLLFVSGILGEFIRALPITIITSLAVSLIVSLTLIPLLSKYFMLGKKYNESRNPVHNAEEFISNLLAHTIKRTKKIKQRAILVSLAALVSLGSIVAAVPLFGQLKFDIFPATKDGDGLTVTLSYPDGTTIEEANKRATLVDQKIISVLGENLERATYFGTGNERSATIAIDLIPIDKRDVKSPELVEAVAEALVDIDGVKSRVSQIDVGPSRDDYPFKMQIYGDEIKARSLASDIEKVLSGRTVTRANGSEVKISRTKVSVPSVLTRKDNRPYIEVSAGFDASDTSALVLAAQQKVQDTYNDDLIRSYGLDPSDIAFDFGSESDNQESFKGVLIAFPILLGVMFVLLAAQFRSLLQPLLIFSAIPFSFFGVAAGLFATNNPLSFFVMVALFALIGIAVNNTILLTDYANQERANGLGRIDAVASAVKQRFRPLVTTSLTSVIALIPLALSDPFWEGLAYTIIFGLLSSTILVLIAFPYYYLGFEWARIKVSRHTALMYSGSIILGLIVSSILGIPLYFAVVFVVATPVVRLVSRGLL